jgi:hypothetical protein
LPTRLANLGSDGGGSVEGDNCLTTAADDFINPNPTVGQYNLVSWALNSFGVPLDDFLPGAGP